MTVPRPNDGRSQLAVNYSPAASDRARAGPMPDLFKCPPWADLVAEAQGLRPVFVHFDLAIGGGATDERGLAEVERWLERTETRFVNAHLAPPSDSPAAAAGLEAAFEQARADLEGLVARFGAQRVIVENVPWERRPDYEIHAVAAEPELLRRLVEDSGCGLLLDLAHARFAAEERGDDVRAYVAALPTTHLAELHVTGLGPDSSGRRRDHMPMSDEDWRLLEWSLEHVEQGRWPRPWAVALEYGGVGPLFEWRSSETVLARDLERLAALLQGVP